MNFAEIENVWRSSHNQPSAAQLEKQKMEFITELRRRRRGNLLFLGLILIPLVFITAKVVLHVFWPDPALEEVDLSREWAIVPFFALPWIGWLFMVRLHYKVHGGHRHSERTISASVAALLDESRSERTRYKFIAGLLIASVPLVGVIIHQLRAVGKAGDEILIPALVLYPAYVVGVLVWSFVHDRRKLRPREQHLASLLSEYNAAAGSGDPAR